MQNDLLLANEKKKAEYELSLLQGQLVKHCQNTFTYQALQSENTKHSNGTSNSVSSNCQRSHVNMNPLNIEGNHKTDHVL